MKTYQEALELILSYSVKLPSEIIDLTGMNGRVLAEDITSDRHYPPFNRSAMDGYALKASDFVAGQSYIISEVIFAGDKNRNVLSSGQVYKIMTGAAVPADADIVIKREEAEEENNIVKFTASGVKPWQNIAIEGEDLKKGEIALRKGIRLHYGHASVLASLGIAKISVFRKPKVAILTTGNEVKEISEIVSSFQIRNCNRYSLHSFLSGHGIDHTDHSHVEDTPEALQKTVKSFLANDILILTGGVSAGDADHVPAALKACGVQEVFHKVKIRPGKPFWFGMYQNRLAVFAFPGNPLSVQVGCKIFLEPYLASVTGTIPAEPMALPLLSARKKKVSLDEFFPVRIRHEKVSAVEPLVFNGSGDITSLADADGIALHPASSEDLVEGDVVRFYWF